LPAAVELNVTVQKIDVANRPSGCFVEGNTTDGSAQYYFNQNVGTESYPSDIQRVCPGTPSQSVCLTPRCGEPWCWADPSCACQDDTTTTTTTSFTTTTTTSAISTTTSGASRDPHFVFAHGGRADIKGDDQGIYNILSARNFNFNVRFAYGDFVLPRKLVHGSYMSAASFTLRTTGPDPTGTCQQDVSPESRLLFVLFDGTVENPVAVVHESGKNDIRLEGNQHYRADNVMIKFAAHGKAVVVSNDCWEVICSVKGFPNPEANPGKYLLHIKVNTLHDTSQSKAFPHGIIGQSYDGDDVAVFGETDNYKVEGSEMSTEAQGEGAIEGVISQYKMPSAFSTDFMYSRFDAVEAPPRDVTKLTGHKVKASAAAIQAGTAGAEASPHVVKLSPIDGGSHQEKLSETN